MNDYKIIISEDISLIVKADDFEIKNSTVAFSRGDKNIACFSMNSIKGFYKENDEKVNVTTTVDTWRK